MHCSDVVELCEESEEEPENWEDDEDDSHQATENGWGTKSRRSRQLGKPGVDGSHHMRNKKAEGTNTERLGDVELNLRTVRCRRALQQRRGGGARASSSGNVSY